MTNASYVIDLLNNENYDTWKIQMRALLILNDVWGYVSGEIPKPPGDATEWVKNDMKARSDIVLSIGASEVRQIRGCETSREVWLKLEGIYHSKERIAAQKVGLFYRLVDGRMGEGDDVREHVNGFFDAVRKLAEMDIQIDSDLLSILLLRSLPRSLDNFRCVIQSMDELPKPETLRMKILDLYAARNNLEPKFLKNSMISNKKHSRNSESNRNRGQSNAKNNFKLKCFGCGKYGHKVAECLNKAK